MLILPFLVLGGVILWDTFLNPIEYTLKPAVVLAGEPLILIDFFEQGGRPEGVSIEFLGVEPVEFTPGLHSIDMNVTRRLRGERAVATLYVLEIKESVDVEYALQGQFLTPYDFIEDFDVTLDIPFSLEFVETLPDLSTLPTGQKPVELVLNYITYVMSAINVKDTTPPTVITQNITVPIGQEITPDSFIIDIIDASPVTSVAFTVEPDLSTISEQTVEIEVVDFYGNRASVEATLKLLPNETPPAFIGVRDITVMKDTSIMFRQGVTALDALGRELEFTVDSSQVNFNELGIYPATYMAEDEWGLRTEVEITVTITSVDPEEVRRRVDEILDGILRDGMTQVEQARVIFDWVVQNVEYAAGIGQDNVYEAAFQALQHRRGHCFVFYGISEVMLTQAGIPNMRIERIPGTPTRHRWNLINPDGLGWHHFDTNQNYAGSEWFMFTSSRARWRADVIRDTVEIVEYYTYDPALYPDIVQ